MRFKYYLRGAGIGVIVATLVLAIAFLFQDNISDEEVIRRAMKLGMVMQENKPGTLADIPQGNASSVDLETDTDEDPLTETDQTNVQDQLSDTDDKTNTDEPSDTDDKTNTDEPSDTDDKTNTDEPSDTDDKTNADEPSDTDDKTEPSSGQDSEDHKRDDANGDKPAKKDSDEVKIVIESGDVSRMVSAKVFEAGLVEDADEFNSYLGSHDYDNQLQPGTYKIKKGSSFRQIAQILTRQ